MTEPSSSLVPFPRAPLPPEKKRGRQQVGPRLEKLRRRLGYSMAAVSQSLDIDQRILDAYEIGTRLPSDELLLRLAAFYDVDVRRIIGDVDDAVPNETEETLWLSWAEIKLEPDDTNRVRLGRIASSLRSIRGLAEDAPVTIRTEEVITLARVLVIEDSDLRADLQHCLALDDADVDELAARLWYEDQKVKELPS